MSHKKIHTQGFRNGRNELGGIVVGGEAVPHGPSLVEVTLKFEPDGMRDKEAEFGKPTIRIVMTKSKWDALKPNLEKEDDGTMLALAVILPTNVDLEILPDEPDVTNEKKPDVKNKEKRNVTNKKKR